MDLSNILYFKKLRNFDSKIYWFNALTSSKVYQILGAIPPKPKESPMELFFESVDGLVNKPPINRRKRAITPPFPECQNLPAYKNWAEEGKTKKRH